MTSQPSITHSEERSRCELRVDGELRHALEAARSAGKTVIATCPFASSPDVAFAIGAPDAA
jgi:hypothetical protein